MGHFLYFVPGGAEGRWDFQRAAAAGLGHAFEPRRPIYAVGAQGPGDLGPGVLLAQNPADPATFAAGYRERRWAQVALPNPESPIRCPHVGLEAADPPGPEDLQRADVTPGELVLLGDGREWLVPTAVLWDTTTEPITWASTVPRRITLDADGRVCFGEPVPSHRALLDAAQRIWNARIGARVDDDRVVLETVTTADLVDVAVTALGQNYRLGIVEAALLLGLFDQVNVIAVIDAVLDWGTFVAWTEKKTATPPGG